MIDVENSIMKEFREILVDATCREAVEGGHVESTLAKVAILDIGIPPSWGLARLERHLAEARSA